MDHRKRHSRRALFWIGLLIIALSLTWAGPSPAHADSPATWNPTGSMIVPRGDGTYTATLLRNGKVLVVGGGPYVAGVPGRTTELYDPVTGTWSRAADTRCHYDGHHHAVLLSDGKVLVVGGNFIAGDALCDPPTNSSGNDAPPELYDPATNTWSNATGPGGAYPRDTTSATLLDDGRVLVLDRMTSNGVGAAIYEPATATWSDTGPMHCPGRFNHSATLLADGRVLVAGGRINSPAVACHSWYYASSGAELYDPVTNSWSETGQLGALRMGHQAVLLVSGKVLIAGGWGYYPPDTNLQSLASAELYDPVTSTWSPTGSMSTRRSRFALTPLRDGTVLASGGICNWVNCYDPDHFHASTEVYDPNHELWGPSSSMSRPREMHTATLLTNSTVLVTGGAHISPPTAEVYGQSIVPMPPNVSLTPIASNSGGVPAVYWESFLTLSVKDQCPGGTATYQVVQGSSVLSSGSMVEGPSGTYSASIPPLRPAHGLAGMQITVTCPDGTSSSFSFHLYIDPSGVVQDTLGNPIAGATVTLYRSDTPSGAFTVVPDGSIIMSPSNRTNPDTTDTEGHFGWDVLTGYYVVRASKEGCYAPDNPAQLYVETEALEIPPPVTDLVLVLACPSANQPPVVTVGADTSGDEGTAVTLGATVSDPDADTLTVQWEYTVISATPGATCTFADVRSAATTITCTDNGTYRATLTVSDGVNPAVSGSATVTVNNVAPAITGLVLDAAVIDENGMVTLNGGFSDPGLDAHEVTIDWGDGSTAETITLNGGERTFSASHRYLDDNPTGTSSDAYPIQVTVTDSDGGNDTDSTSVTVRNVAPVLGTISPSTFDPVAVNSSVSISASFTDVGSADTHSATIDWGDGTNSAGTVTSGAVGGTHLYTTAGVHTVKLTLTDDDTGADSEPYQYIVVYDPDAGFVTGGGWIDSPAGAYTANPTLTGKANFGFVSKYKKGTTVPDGQTQFQFHAAGFNFHSTSYDWLVISGPKAQYKGSGTINEEGEYGFMLTANDGQISGGGGVDRFRIKIWEKATDVIVYDNQMGADDTADASQAVAGGSIVIHNK